MAISNKKCRQVHEALSKTSFAMLCELAPESIDYAPELWDPETRRIFDLLADFETKARIAIDAVLHA